MNVFQLHRFYCAMKDQGIPLNQGEERSNYCCCYDDDFFLLLLLSGSNLGEMLPWNKKMYNPKVTWKLTKRDVDVVDLVSCGAVRSRKLIRVEHSETR